VCVVRGVIWSITSSHYFTTVQWGADACPRRRVGLLSVAVAMLAARNPWIWLPWTPRLRSFFRTLDDGPFEHSTICKTISCTQKQCEPKTPTGGSLEVAFALRRRLAPNRWNVVFYFSIWLLIYVHVPFFYMTSDICAPWMDMENAFLPSIVKRCVRHSKSRWVANCL
jgi:hypothetical protein